MQFIMSEMSKHTDKYCSFQIIHLYIIFLNDLSISQANRKKKHQWYHCFLSAPVQQAEPVDSWNDVFDASKEGPSCPLPAVPELTSEDCLRLNVYTTKVSNIPIFYYEQVFFFYRKSD